jgi:hypothetical protein
MGTKPRPNRKDKLGRIVAALNKGPQRTLNHYPLDGSSGLKNGISFSSAPARPSAKNFLLGDDREALDSSSGNRLEAAELGLSLTVMTASSPQAMAWSSWECRTPLLSRSNPLKASAFRGSSKVRRAAATNHSR